MDLGKICSKYAERDAVHVAIAPVVTNEGALPGGHVGLLEGDEETVTKNTRKKIGIIDPFLQGKIKKGTRVYLVLYPGSITSLRHHWFHPSFTKEVSDKDASVAWMNKFASSVGLSYDEVMSFLDNSDDSGCHFGDDRQSDEAYDNRYDLLRHYEIITGTTFINNDISFRCSC